MSEPPSDKIQVLIDALYEWLTSPDPDQPYEGPELVIELVPNDVHDDPRILELLQLLAATGSKAIDASKLETVDFGSGVHVPEEGEIADITEAIELEHSERLAEQAREVEAQRELGTPRSKSPKEQYEIRRSFVDSIDNLNLLANELARWCADHIRKGCTWWEDRVPAPIRNIAEGSVAGAVAYAAKANPAVTLVVAVCIVSLVSRRRRK